VHRLEQGLGTVLASDIADVGEVLDVNARAALERAGLVLGAAVAYVPAGLGPAGIAAKLALATTWYGAGRALRPPSGGAVSFPAGRGVDHAAYCAIGFPVFAGRAIRADIVERIATVGPPLPEDATLASWLGCPTKEVRRIVTALPSLVPAPSSNLSS
jgi:ATP-dependent RNA helicase SUPV3L1/SUV3